MIRFINVKQKHSDNLKKHGINHQFAFGQISVEINLSSQKRINEALVDMLKYLAEIGNKTEHELLDVTKTTSLIKNNIIKKAESVTPKLSNVTSENLANSFSMKAITSYLLKAHNTNSRQQLNRFAKKHKLHKYGTIPAITIARPELEYSDDVAVHDGVFFNFSSSEELKKIKIERPRPSQHTLESIRDCDDQIKYLFENVKELTDLQMIWFMTNIIDYQSAKNVINQLKKRDGRIAVFYKIAKDMYPEPLSYSKIIGDNKFRFDYVYQAVNSPFIRPYKVLSSPKAFTQEEQSERLKKVFEIILDDQSTSIHCVKVDAGTGKTRVMLEDFFSYNMAYLTLTHKLLLQSLDDLKKFNPMLWNETVYIPKIEDNELPDCDKKLQLIESRRIGDHKKASQLQREIIKERGDSKLKKKLAQYEKAMKAEEGVPFITFQRFLTTHMFHHKFKNVDTFLIDEDIVRLLFPNYEHADDFVIFELNKMIKFAVSHYDLKEKGFGKEEEQTAHQEELIRLIKEIRLLMKMIRQNETVKDNTSQSFFKSNHNLILKLIRKMQKENKKVKMNYFDIFESEILVKKNNGNATKFYHNNSKRMRGKKLIIMSATLDKDIHIPLLARLINPDIKFHDLGRTEIKGNLYQYADFSTTKFSLKNKEERTKVISNLLPKLNVDNVITYKDNKEQFGYITDQMHFYNSAGYNDLSGKDIAIVGTPNGQPEDVVALGYLIYKKLPKSYVGGTLVFKNQSVFKDEWKLPLYTFAHEDDTFFRKLHLWSTYNELVQAAGRARQTHHENTCYIFSQLPLPQAQIKSYSEVI